jgi:hypothetical protein
VDRAIDLIDGKCVAGLADIMNVRTLFLISSFGLILAGAVALILPALGETALEWKRVFNLLRGIEAALQR